MLKDDKKKKKNSALCSVMSFKCTHIAITIAHRGPSPGSELTLLGIHAVPVPLHISHEASHRAGLCDQGRAARLLLDSALQLVSAYLTLHFKHPHELREG